MQPIAIDKNKILILKSDAMYSKKELERIRQDVIKQLNEGVLIIPNGFTYLIMFKE